MKPVRYIASLLLLIFPMMAFAQFVGEIEMSTFNANNKENANLIWSMKNGKHLMEIESKSGDYVMNYGLIINERKRKVWFLSDNHHSRSAYAVPYAQLEKNELNLPLNSVVKDLGVSESMAGVKCQKYQIISSTHIVECWLSSELGITHSDFPSFMNTGDLLGLLKLSKIQAIPVKFEVKNASGDIILSQEMNKVTAKNIADERFEVPSDYTKNEGNTKK